MEVMSTINLSIGVLLSIIVLVTYLRDQEWQFFAYLSLINLVAGYQ